MIISASRRTDIPAFFGEWFINRINEGFCRSVNPFNPGQVKRVSLQPEDVDVIVFWSKNPAPFVKHLDYLDSKGYRYYFQFTLNDYPAVFEPNVPSVEERIAGFITLSRKIGAPKVVWRYDPIVISSITPVEYHLKRISALAGRLKGCTERLVISFMDFYTKLDGRLKKLEAEEGITFHDITAPEGRDSLEQLACGIKTICDAEGIEVFSCAEKTDLEGTGIKHGSCIDGELINRLFNTGKVFRRDGNQRKECLCAASTDIGAYNTCKFQCSYCYANFSGKSIHKNLERYSVKGDSLIARE